jgi:hypothetical protein
MKKKIIFFLLIFFTLLLNNSYTKELSNNVVVSINNEIITELDINKEMNFIKFVTKSESTKKLSEFKAEAVQALIDRKIKNIEANNLKVLVSEKEVEISIYNYLAGQNIKIEDLNAFYKAHEIEDDYLKNIIKVDMQWSQMIRGIYENRINVNLTEVNKELQKENQNASENQKLKDQLIITEQNILLNKFAASHLEKSKKKYLIKFL